MAHKPKKITLTTMLLKFVVTAAGSLMSRRLHKPMKIIASRIEQFEMLSYILRMYRTKS